MLYPSYRDLMQKVNNRNDEIELKSRYSIVIATSKRARQIVEELAPKKEEKKVKPEISRRVSKYDKVPSLTSFVAPQIEEVKPTKNYDPRKKPLSIAIEELYNGTIDIKS